jgi:hypothetical protein
MSGSPDNDRASTRPFLIQKDGEGEYRLYLRETRFNSQNYPIVTATPVEEVFKTTAAARAYAKANFGAVAGDFAMK